MKGFSSLDPSGHEGKTNTWLTPLWIIEALGSFDMDPCAFPGHATAAELISLPIDGLKVTWDGRVWLNPPYGRLINRWLRKLESHGDGIALVFARTDTNWFHELKPDAFFFMHGRVKFLKADFTESTNAGHGSMLLVYGKNNVNAVRQANLSGKLSGWLFET